MSPEKSRREGEKVWQRPKPRPGDGRPTVWLDYATAAGVTIRGEQVLPVLGGGRRKNAKLVDLLNTALNQHVDRVVVCGEFPQEGDAWLLPSAGESMEDFLPGWEARDHHTAGDITGRFTHIESGHKLELRTTAAWFTVYPMTPKQAQWSTVELARIVALGAKWKDSWPLLENPGATGRNLWKALAPSSYGMERMDPEIGHFIQATSPQGRNEHFVEGPSRCDCGDCPPLIAAGTEIPGFCYVDGRFMYAGVITSELGAAPAAWLNADDATALWNDPTEKGHYPARYHIRFTVPDDWFGPGMFAVKRNPDDPSSGWHWPNLPGATHTTWCDAAELVLARTWGWTDFEILEGIKLTKCNSLQPFTRAIQRMVTEVDTRWADTETTNYAQVRKVLGGAIKQMFRVTIGSFSARAPLTTKVTTDPAMIPATAQQFEAIRDEDTGQITHYTYKVATHSLDPDTWHPEIAARVWALSRVRTLHTPVKTLRKGPDGKTLKPKAGVLEVPPEALIGMQTDALYATYVPEWALPFTVSDDGTEFGGDDGSDGRLRVKGYVTGPMPAPATRTERGDLSLQAETNGLKDTPYA